MLRKGVTHGFFSFYFEVRYFDRQRRGFLRLNFKFQINPKPKDPQKEDKRAFRVIFLNQTVTAQSILGRFVKRDAKRALKTYIVINHTSCLETRPNRLLEVRSGESCLEKLASFH